MVCGYSRHHARITQTAYFGCDLFDFLRGSFGFLGGSLALYEIAKVHYDGQPIVPWTEQKIRLAAQGTAGNVICCAVQNFEG